MTIQELCGQLWGCKIENYYFDLLNGDVKFLLINGNQTHELVFQNVSSFLWTSQKNNTKAFPEFSEFYCQKIVFQMIKDHDSELDWYTYDYNLLLFINYEKALLVKANKIIIDNVEYTI